MPALETIESYNRCQRAADDTRQADRKAREKQAREKFRFGHASDEMQQGKRRQPRNEPRSNPDCLTPIA
jgi:hypothetical protein